MKEYPGSPRWVQCGHRVPVKAEARVAEDVRKEAEASGVL